MRRKVRRADGSGHLLERGTYQAYGGAESDYRPGRWKGFREDYGFTGKESDVEVGLAYFGKRYLAPLLNRWISPDPLAVHVPGDADLNVYAYVSGRAPQAVDPFGLEKKPPESKPDQLGEFAVTGCDQAGTAAACAEAPGDTVGMPGDTYIPGAAGGSLAVGAGAKGGGGSPISRGGSGAAPTSRRGQPDYGADVLERMLLRDGNMVAAKVRTTTP